MSTSRDHGAAGFRARYAADPSDLVAFGCLLASVDPSLLNKSEWAELCGWYEEMDDSEMKVFLTEPSQHKRSLPSKNLLKRPREIDATYLRLLLVRQRGVERPPTLQRSLPPGSPFA